MNYYIGKVVRLYSLSWGPADIASYIAVIDRINGSGFNVKIIRTPDDSALARLIGKIYYAHKDNLYEYCEPNDILKELLK